MHGERTLQVPQASSPSQREAAELVGVGLSTWRQLEQEFRGRQSPLQMVKHLEALDAIAASPPPVGSLTLERLAEEIVEQHGREKAVTLITMIKAEIKRRDEEELAERRRQNELDRQRRQEERRLEAELRELERQHDLDREKRREEMLERHFQRLARR